MQNIYGAFRKYEEQDARIRQITGYGLNEIEKKLAAGWTLCSPKPPLSFLEFEEDYNKRTAEEIAEMITGNMGLDCYRCPFEATKCSKSRANACKEIWIAWLNGEIEATP